jgi:hypothetical protein
MIAGTSPDRRQKRRVNLASAQQETKAEKVSPLFLTNRSAAFFFVAPQPPAGLIRGALVNTFPVSCPGQKIFYVHVGRTESPRFPNNLGISALTTPEGNPALVIPSSLDKIKEEGRENNQ